MLLRERERESNTRYRWTFLQQPPWGQKKVAEWRGIKQESMYGFFVRRGKKKWPL